MADLDIALLGSLEITLDRQPIDDLRYDKVRALLAYLVIERRQHTRSALAALLWPDATEAMARKSLRNALATLRQALGDAEAQRPFLLITRDTIQFNPGSSMQLDIAQFNALLAACAAHRHPDGSRCDACAKHLQQVVALYRGEFLSQVGIANSVQWEEWVLLVREQLHCQALDALAKLVGYHEHRGEDALARTYAWRALALEPWNEEMHRALMRVLARSGRRNAALAHYKRCQAILAKELGLQPADETTALYQRIQAGPLTQFVGGTHATPLPADFAQHTADLAGAVPPRHGRGTARGVSAAPTRDRHGATADVQAAPVQHASIRLLTSARLAGATPTCLGLAIGEGLAGATDNGVYVVALVPICDEALAAAARIQRIDDQALAQSLAASLREYAGDNAVQLVLDNFERVLANWA